MSPESGRVRAGALAELSKNRVLHTTIGRGLDGTPREALVLLDDGEQVRAYLNRCRHLPIPIDGGTRRFLDDDERHLICRTHGALYRREDGYCVSGPCRGLSLHPIRFEIDDEGIIWVEETPPI